MSYFTKLMCVIILLTIPTIQYGGYFLLQIISGKYSKLNLTNFQKTMFRAGHAHAGILVILAIIAQILVDYSSLPSFGEWFVRLGFPLSAILVSSGFFGAASGNQTTQPTKLIWILYVGVIVLFFSLVTLGIGLTIN